MAPQPIASGSSFGVSAARLALAPLVGRRPPEIAWRDRRTVVDEVMPTVRA
jgi:hypothetical protein